MKRAIIGILIGAFFGYGCGREIKEKVKIEVSGSVSMLVTSGEFSIKPAEGATVKLQADYNGDGEIANNEMGRVYVEDAGRFGASIWIPGNFKGNVVLIVEKEGYTSAVKTFPPKGSFRTDILLYPRERATCKNGRCYVPSKSIIVENVPENVAEGEMAVFNPVKESDVFPGNFIDSEGKMLISTVFGEIKLYDEGGNEIKSAGEIKVKMLIPIDTYSTLDDHNPDTERVEVPMFYFDEAKGVWVESVDGYLEYEGGKKVKRDELQAIKEWKYAGNIYSVFYAPHLSWWNVDWKNPYVTCLMGRVLVDDVVTSGVYVEGFGVNYNLPGGPTAPTNVCTSLWGFTMCVPTFGGSPFLTRVYTDENGWFVLSVFKSEPQNVDEDGDGISGEVHKTSITISYDGQTWNAGEFVSPQRYSPLTEGNLSCYPLNCACENIGDIKLSTSVAPPPPCELYGVVKYSGIETISYGFGNPPSPGSPVSGVNVSIFDKNMSPERKAEICVKDGEDFCIPQTSDESGRFHIYYAVDLSANYFAELVLKSGEEEEGFRGNGSIEGCPSSSPEEPYVITVDYYYKGNEKYPTAPQSLTASAECSELVNLSWIDRSDNEDGFYIERKTEEGTYALLADLPPDTQLHYDSTTKRSTSYCYRVIAYRTENGVKYSSPSREFCYTTPSKFCPPPPPSPSNLSGTMTPSLVSLTWKEVSREKGYKITKRIVVDGPCSEGGGELPIDTVYKLGYVEIGIAGEDASSFNDSRVKSLVCYCYRVFAFNDAGNSGSSNPFCGIVPECNEGQQRSCYTGPEGTLGVGICSAGVQTCSSGRWGTCEGEVTPSEEICDGYDNNCNGLVDEGENLAGSSPFYRDDDEDSYGREDVKYLCYSQPPYSAIIDGDCDDGNLTINPGAQELCDGYDNNCDTNVDEGCSCITGQTQSCYSGPPGTEGVGICIAGTQTCNENGEWEPCEGEVLPSEEICGDELDNDCDSFTDETCDTIPPETILTSYPPSTTTSTIATFEFTCNEEPCTYNCRIDGGEWASCSSPYTYSALALGQHIFEVKAFDQYMNEDPTPASYQWKIMSTLVDMLWEAQLPSTIDSSPVFADVNGDGFSDVIITTKDPAKVICLNGSNGETLWVYTPSENDLNFTTPSLGDIDNDGKLEIVFGSYYAKVYALNSENGTQLWIYSTGFPPNYYSVSSTPVIKDRDGDGILDVIVPAYSGGIHVIRGNDGSQIRIYPTSGWNVMNSSPAFGDINNDGIPDIVLGGFDNNSNIFAVSTSGSGSILWAYSTNAGIRSSPSIADLNSDGYYEVVVGSFDGNVYAVDRNGTLFWSYPTGGQVLSSPAIADIDNDESLDVVIGSRDKAIYALSSTGTLLWSFITNGGIDSSPVVGDIDGDGNLEVVVGSSDQHLYVLNGEDGSLLWKYLLSNSIVSSPLLGDVNGDGKIDIVVVGSQGKVYALTTPFDLPRPAFLPWPEFGNASYMRTRNVDPWEYNDSVTYAVKLIDSGFSYHAIPGYVWNGGEYDFYSIRAYPSSATEILVYLTDIPSSKDYDLCLYDENMTSIECSENSSNSSELIIYPLSLSEPVTFYIEVYSASGYSPVQPYSLFVHLY